MSDVIRAAVLAIVVLAGFPGGVARAAPPNVLVIETDDQRASDMDAMPRTRAAIGGSGVTFVNAVVSQPQCCPSRATFLTGQYAHNHGVRAIGPPFGGYDRLAGAETLPVWLARRGYATGVVGKYLNGFGRRRPTEVPPGWAAFAALLGASTYRFYGYTLNEDGVLRTYGTSTADYQTDVITARSEALIRGWAGHRPFFLWTTYVAPHTGQPRDLLDPVSVATAVPAPRHGALAMRGSFPRSPAFDEADVADKPRAIRRRPRLGARRVTLTEVWRQRRASLAAVDEGVERLVRALADTGELERTLVIFTSDNGFMLGEHRLPGGKVVPYEPSIRVPLLMRGPGIPAGARRRQLAWNGDLAPTILDATRAAAPFALDGRSLLPLARSAVAGRGRAVVLEGPPARATLGRPRYTGLRTARRKYVEHLGGAVELYDLERDPHELRNLASAPGASAVRRRLASRLERLRACVGAACR